MKLRAAFLLSVLIGVLAPAGIASAAPEAAPAWSVRTVSQPTIFSSSPARNESCEERPVFLCDTISLVPSNLGSKASEGPVEITDELPEGLRILAIESFSGGAENSWSCTHELVGSAEVATCHLTFFGSEEVAALGFAATISFALLVEPGTTGPLVNHVTISGGGASPVTAESTTLLGPGSEPFSLNQFEAGALDPAGGTAVQAGSHPGGLTASFLFPSEFKVIAPGSANENRRAVQNVRQLVTDLPPGVIGNATSTPTCTLTDVTNLIFGFEQCPAASHIGTGALIQPGGVEPGLQVFNLTPEHGYPAEFGVYEPNLKRALLLYASVVGSGRNAHIRVTSGPQSTLAEEVGVSLNFFGHPGTLNGLPASQKPLFTLPSDCTAPGFSTQIHVDSWEEPGAISSDGVPLFSNPAWKSASSASPPVTGCEFLHFSPSVSFKPEGSSADSPTGLKVDVHVPQNEDPDGLSTPPLREATVTLPKGLAVNPSSADGLAGCTPVQIAAETNDPGACPQASQIGEVEISTPLLDHPLPGKVFLGTPECSPCTNADASAGKLVKLYIEVNDSVSGVIVKLPGSGSLDPASGQITASFRENPQLPFEDLNLTFKGGPRATLTTPPTCGTYTTTTDLKPWSAPQSGPDATPQSSFMLNSGPNGSACPSSEAGLSNKPAFEAGTTTPLAGAYSPFVLKLSREDGSQRFGSLETILPEGLVGRLAGIPYCPDGSIAAASGRSGAAEKASPSCPAASEVGTVNVGAGSGTPFYVQGKAYLAGPYKGAPISLAIITPAVAGPFDLGTVVVRTALYVNEYSAQVRAVSDQIPSILAGIPLDVRSIALQLNRSNFTLNPSSCEVKEITGSVTSTLGQTAALKNRFQVGACGALGFKPGLKISLGGQTRRIGHPALKAVLTYPKEGAYSNVARALVNLPGSEFLDQGNLNETCTKPVLQAGKCPASTVYGKAKAWTPLLEKPLEGPVYLVGGFGYKLPALVAELNGQIRVLLVGKVDSGKNHGIRNTFEAVPDAPVSRFVLEMKGGKKYGLLENSQNICKHQQKAIARFTAQNGKTYDTEPVIQVGCGKGKSKNGGKRKAK